jgi:hypothetical protein
MAMQRLRVCLDVIMAAIVASYAIYEQGFRH